jgi:hypothetical protein
VGLLVCCRLQGSYPKTEFEEVIESNRRALRRLTRKPDKWNLCQKDLSGNAGGLNGSTQHWLEVYL